MQTAKEVFFSYFGFMAFYLLTVLCCVVLTGEMVVPAFILAGPMMAIILKMIIPLRIRSQKLKIRYSN